MPENSNIFNTMDVRPWDKPQLLNQKPISNDPHHTTSFPMGLNWLDIDRTGNVHIKAYALGNPNGGTTVHLDASGDAILYSAGSTWLNVCKNDRDFQFGTFSTVGNEKSSPSWTTQVTFDKPYGSAPKVVVWFNEFEFDKAHNSGASKLLRKTLLPRASLSSSPPEATRNCTRRREFRPWSAPQLDNKKSITFDKKFECPPRIVVGLNLFDIDCNRNFRLEALAKDVTAQGMTLHLDSWYDTTQYASRADYIAIQDY
ncbi:hypothetical protein FRC07_007390 [Ceratobasidium sp. 392]|nr:hypothetical protein FRC07_007390 [Ceratobasidium sp. 392]